MDRPLVTIGIPTFNRADKFLRDAIDSACQQTYPTIEIIIADNCSSDNTSDLVKGIDDARITYYRHEKNIGPENNFNFLLEKSTGDYFLLFHDDDRIDADYVETCMESAEYKTHFGLIRTGIRIIDENGLVVHEKENHCQGDRFEDKMMAWFKNTSPWYLCNTLFNAKKLKEIGGFRSKRKLLQDGVAVTKISADCPTLDVSSVKASFRKHGGEITFSVRVTDWVDDFLALLDLMESLAASNKKELIRSEGERFFSRLSYHRAKAVATIWGRWTSYWCVYKAFNYRYLPPPITRKISRFKNLVDSKEDNQ